MVDPAVDVSGRQARTCDFAAQRDDQARPGHRPSGVWRGPRTLAPAYVERCVTVRCDDRQAGRDRARAGLGSTPWRAGKSGRRSTRPSLEPRVANTDLFERTIQRADRNRVPQLNDPARRACIWPHGQPDFIAAYPHMGQGRRSRPAASRWSGSLLSPIFQPTHPTSRRPRLPPSPGPTERRPGGPARSRPRVARPLASAVDRFRPPGPPRGVDASRAGCSSEWSRR